MAEILQTAQQFASLEEEWEDLYRNSPAATPFQSWAWLYSWWEYYGEDYELRLIAARDDEGTLVGVIPLMLEQRRGVGRLLFVGTGQSDYLDVLARAGREDEVFEAGAQALERMGSWLVADLQLVRPEAAAWGLLRRWDRPGSHVRQDGCPVVEVKPWDTLVKSLSKSRRKTVRQSLRKAEKDGVYRRLASAEDAEQAARRLVALHRESWQGRNIGPQHLTQRFESFIVTAARRMTACDAGGISEFWRGEEVVISAFLLFGRDQVGTHTVGASQQALQEYQWSSHFIWDALEVARSRNNGYLDLLRGEEPYKLRWSDEVVPTYRLILGKRLFAWFPYAGYHALRTRAKQYAKSETSPQWVKSARRIYREARYKITRHVKRT